MSVYSRIAAVLPLLLTTTRFAAGQALSTDFDVSSYDLGYKIDLDAGVFEAEHDILITNTSANQLDRVRFLLHPDLQVDEVTIRDLANVALPVKEWIQVQRESILGNELQTIQVRIARMISPDQRLTLHLKYHLARDAFRYGLQHPEGILGLFVDSKMSQAIGPYTGHNAIFSWNVMAPFRMTIERPTDLLCAAPGNKTSSRGAGDTVIETYRSEIPGIPTFSCSSYQKYVKEDAGITFEYYLYPGLAIPDDMVLTSARIANLYTKTFGDTGTDTYRFAHVGARNSEYPGWESKGNAIFFTDLTTRHYEHDEFFRAMFAGMVAHEIFHNWNIFSVHWAGARTEWLEEGGANFVAAWACERLFAPEVAIGGRAHFATSYDEAFGDRGPGSTETLESVSKTELGSSESVLIYYYGALVWEQLRQKLGDEVLFAALGEFFREYRLKTVTYRDLLRSLQAKTHVDVGGFLDQWMKDNARVDLSIGDVRSEGKSGRFRTEVDLVIEADRDLELFTSIGYTTPKDSGLETVAIHATKTGVQTIRFESEYRPVLIRVDPFFRVPQVNLANNVWSE